MNLKTIHFAVLATLTALLSHCGKKDSEESSAKQSDADAAAGEFLSPDDLKITANVNSLASYSVKTKIENTSGLYDHLPKKVDAQDCYTALFNNSKVTATTSTVEFHAVIDATSCFQESLKSSSVALVQSREHGHRSEWLDGRCDLFITHDSANL